MVILLNSSQNRNRTIGDFKRRSAVEESVLQIVEAI